MSGKHGSADHELHSESELEFRPLLVAFNYSLPHLFGAWRKKQQPIACFPDTVVQLGFYTVTKKKQIVTLAKLFGYCVTVFPMLIQRMWCL